MDLLLVERLVAKITFPGPQGSESQVQSRHINRIHLHVPGKSEVKSSKNACNLRTRETRGWELRQENYSKFEASLHTILHSVKPPLDYTVSSRPGKTTE